MNKGKATPPSTRSWLSSLLQAIGRLARPRYRAQIAPSATALSAPPKKLQPIDEVLTRTGREPPAPG